MRKLTGLVVVLFVLWGGWWAFTSRMETRLVRAAFAERKAAGWTADYSSLGVAGFPNRLDLTVNDIALGAPGTGVIWRAPFAQVLGLTYNPWHVIAAFPNSQEIETPAGTFTLGSSRMEASLEPRPGLDFTLASIVAVIDKPVVTASLGWQVSADYVRVATRQVPGRASAQEIGVETANVTPDAALHAALDPTGTLPPALSRIYLDAEAGFTAPIDRRSATTPPLLTDLAVKQADVLWGPMRLSATGKVTVDAQGTPAGRITLSAKGWRQMVPVAVALGLVRPELEQTVTNMLAELAKGSGKPDTVDLPLVFEKGWMSLGPLPLGPAPRLR